MPDVPLPSQGSAATRPNMLSRYGWGEPTASTLAGSLPGDGLLGRVIRTDRGGCLVVTDDGIERCHVPKGGPGDDADLWPPTTGDWVSVRLEPGLGLVLTVVAPRRSALQRNDPSDTGPQVLAANLDTVLVLRGLDRPDKLGRLERFLVMVWDGGATPVVVLTKTDLFRDQDVKHRLTAVAAVAGGADVVAVSCTTGAGMAGLSPYLSPGATVALVGESGAGKSTLANRLAGAEVMAIGATRSGDGKGRHTTTTREMVPLPGGAVLIDTPGLRAVGLWEGEHGVEQVFADIEDLAGGCRFGDCSHSSEPGCAVQAAIVSGVLDERRLGSYGKLQKELAHVGLRNDIRARRAQARAAGRRYRRIRQDKRER